MLIGSLNIKHVGQTKRLPLVAALDITIQHCRSREDHYAK